MVGRKAGAGGGGGGAELAFEEWIWLSKTPGRSFQVVRATSVERLVDMASPGSC